MIKAEQKKQKTYKINGVEIQNLTTPDLINYRIFYLLVIPVSLLGGVTFLLNGYSFRENLFWAITISSFAIFVLFAFYLGIKMVKNINVELKKREISAEDKILARKKLKKTVVKIAVISVIAFILLVNGVKRMVNDITENKISKYQCSICEVICTDSKDKHSIARTGMCEDCYENYKYVKDSLDEY